MSETKGETYSRLAKEIAAVIEGETSSVARFATVACLLNEAFDHFYWVGFYLVDPLNPSQLVVGPYQGTLGCLRIPIGRGVCGVAAQKLETVLVENVHTFDGHIACDSLSQSEIVVPVFWKNGQLAAVLDVDATELSAFDDIDLQGLEAICATLLHEAIT